MKLLEIGEKFSAEWQMRFLLDRNVLIRFLWINFLLLYHFTLNRLSTETSKLKFQDNIIHLKLLKVDILPLGVSEKKWL